MEQRRNTALSAVSARKVRIGTGIFLGLVLGNLLFAGLIAARSVHAADTYLHPPRKAVTVRPTLPDSELWQDIAFRTDDHLTLHGWYRPSTNGAAVVVTHGFGETRASMLFEGEALAKRGYGILMFDWRGHGESEGDLVTWGDRERRDLRAGLDFVSRQTEVKTARIGAIGFSMGGGVVADVAASDHRLAAIVLEGTYTTARDSILDDFTKWGFIAQMPVEWRFRQAGIDTSAIRAIDAVAKIAPRPILIINGDDHDVPRRIAERLLHAAGSNASYWLVPGSPHGGYAKTAPDAYEKHLVEFFDASLLK